MLSSQAGVVTSLEKKEEVMTNRLKKTSIKMDPLLWKRAKSLAIYSDRQLSELVAEGLGYVFKKYEKIFEKYEKKRNRSQWE